MIACGGSFSLALDINGTIYSWGEGSSGALGTGSFNDILLPKKIELEDNSIKFKYIAAGISNSAAISENGKLYTWGVGLEG